MPRLRKMSLRSCDKTKEKEDRLRDGVRVMVILMTVVMAMGVPCMKSLTVDWFTTKFCQLALDSRDCTSCEYDLVKYLNAFIPGPIISI